MNSTCNGRQKGMNQAQKTTTKNHQKIKQLTKWLFNESKSRCKMLLNFIQTKMYMKKTLSSFHYLIENALFLLL